MKRISQMVLPVIVASSIITTIVGCAHSGTETIRPDGSAAVTTIQVTQEESTVFTTEKTVAETQAETTATTEATGNALVTYSAVDETVYALDLLNVRAGPGTDCEIVGSLSYGESVKRIGVGDNGWSRVIYNEAEAYAYSQYLSVTKPAAESADPSEPEETTQGVQNTEATEPVAQGGRFQVDDGWLYYIKEDGSLLCDASLGRLYFDQGGKYTSGDKELDEIVAGLLRGFQKNNPNGSRTDWLYDAFLYTRDSFKYVNRGLKDVGATGWETEEAKIMFTTGAGNCYNYAAVFCMLARGLGYDSYCVSGLVLEYAQNHGWAEIILDGSPYIFDPNMARREVIGDRSNFGEDMFKVSRDIASWWRYIFPN